MDMISDLKGKVVLITGSGSDNVAAAGRLDCDPASLWYQE